MTRVVAVPATLDDRAFETLVSGAAAREGERLLFDAHRLRWADPYGMMGLLAVGEHVRRQSEAPVLQLPESTEVASYLARMGFFEEAASIFEIHGAVPKRHGGPTNVLLEITPIRSHEDVHGVIDHVQERAGAILSEKLGYSGTEAIGFSMILSEVCQNIIEHADAPGWVGIQTYNWEKRLGRNVVMIAVVDLGVGFHGSLAREHSARFGDRWSDMAALEAAFIHGVTRFRDPGRGQGIKQIRTRVGRWGGKVAIRSGTAQIADVPAWDDAPPLESELTAFPGSQILIILPAKG
jgi:anti-sigma regulatory factor (Ser/Thr protein kinase)